MAAAHSQVDVFDSCDDADEDMLSRKFEARKLKDSEPELAVESVQAGGKKGAGRPRNVKKDKEAITGEKPEHKAVSGEKLERKTDDNCATCMKKVTSQCIGVLCEVCNVWFHCRCQQISDKMYEAMQSFKDDLHWFCSGCRGGAGKLLAVISVLQTKFDKMEVELTRAKTEYSSELIKVTADFRNEMAHMRQLMTANEKKTEDSINNLKTIREIKEKNITDSISQVTSDMKTLDSRLNTCEIKILESYTHDSSNEKSWAAIVANEVDSKVVAVASDIVAREVDSKMVAVAADMTALQKRTMDMQQDIEEQVEIKKRKASVIIHGLEEPTSSDSEDRKRDDHNSMIDLLHQIQCDEVSVNTCIRLGNLQQGPDIKPRPLKLVLSSEAQKDKLLLMAKNLKGNRNGLEKVFIHQDLTPRQRANRQRLVKEMRARLEQGETNLLIIGDKIVTRRQRT